MDKNDKRTNTRRLLLRGAVAIGALSAARILTLPDTDTPKAPVGRNGAAHAAKRYPAAPAPPARGTLPAQAPDTYRLRPLAGEPSPWYPDAPPPHAEVAFTVPTRTREIALTFDDGPEPSFTPQVLRVLRSHDVRATFFVLGECAVAFPEQLHAIVGDGHIVANHSWTHPQFTTLAPGRVRSELGRTSDLIEKTLGSPPTLARAPYGDWDRASLRICNELGMSPVNWSIDSLDWTRPGAGRIARNIMSEMKPGAIVLSHDGGGDRSQTVAALEWYLPRLLDEGYTPIRVEY
ncbi:polysaccharide deacetylase family protein [Streptomyces celluloflavus]|uniref:polysaccharide deacetylase family protein n=1 Tax=Streptomyces celluloflavus TaxID=58344 RepID=UPI00345F5736|nr:polysaccharide deacetylase family protein [Streptomyces celluloflavus]